MNKFSKKKRTRPSYLMKTLSVGAKLFLAGGRTDGGTTMKKLIVTFLNFANGRKKLKVLFFPLILNFRRSIAILEIPRFRLFILLIKAAYILR